MSAAEEESKTVLLKNVVRVGGSFDMGWPTKELGRSYDSLSGTAGFIGLFSKKIITQIILNRKCRMCDLGHPKSDHNCKLNFVDSAKAMEPKTMAIGIRNIPYHCFNLHAYCGEWCKYSKDPESYKHSVIGEGFKVPHLFDLLMNIFDNMADKANEFAGGVSRNPNESFNAILASKSPKSKLYGTSLSYNLCVGLTLLKENEGEKFIIDLMINCQVSPSKKLRKYCEDVDKQASNRYNKAGTTAFKKRRLF